MRRSRVLARLREGGVALVTNISLTGSPKVVELAALAGFDAVWIDHEHRPLNDQDIDAMILASRLHDVDAVVRVRKEGYTSYFRPLESGAGGIMVPHVRSLAEAREVVANAKFPPLGRRGFDGAGADADYARADAYAYIQWANRETFVCVQIEDAEALDHVEAIAALEGIDLLFIGPADLSLSLGVPFQWDHPRMEEAAGRILAAARRHGKHAGMTVCDVPAAVDWIRRGVRFVNIGADLLFLRQALEQVVAEFRTALASHPDRLQTGPPKSPEGEREAR